MNKNLGTYDRSRFELRQLREQAAAETEAAEVTAVSWLLAVRKFGIEEANRMFPEG
jgi:hypothetical protein